MWVGNFDGSPMEGVSGITGAGPLFHDAMLGRRARAAGARASTRPRGRRRRPRSAALSGARPAAACPHRRREVFARAGGARTARRRRRATMHERVRVDRRNGLRAGRGCSGRGRGARLRALRRGAHRVGTRRRPPPRAGRVVAALRRRGARRRSAGAGAGCASATRPTARGSSSTPGSAARQAIRLRADVPPGVPRVRIVLDGASSRSARRSSEWRLVAGPHRLRVDADGAAAGNRVLGAVSGGRGDIPSPRPPAPMKSPALRSLASLPTRVQKQAGANPEQLAPLEGIIAFGHAPPLGPGLLRVAVEGQQLPEHRRNDANRCEHHEQEGNERPPGHMTLRGLHSHTGTTA